VNGLTNFAILVFAIQTVHSLEELSTGFYKKWYLFKMPFKTFLTFEILFEVFWAAVIFYPYFPAREQLLAFFLVLMFANGVQHLVWAGSVKKYVPGLITAIIHCALFLIFYFRILFIN
jgi:hypothetical protein